MGEIGVLICFICFLRAFYLLGYQSGISDTIDYYDNHDDEF